MGWLPSILFGLGLNASPADTPVTVDGLPLVVHGIPQAGISRRASPQAGLSANVTPQSAIAVEVIP